MNFKFNKTRPFFILIMLAFILTSALRADRQPLDSIAARVNGQVIMRSELEERAQPFIQEFSTVLSGDEVAENIDELKKEILDRMIDEILLKKAAEEEGVAVSEADIDRGIEEIRQQFSSEAEFMDEITRQGFTRDTFRGDVAQQIKVIKLIEDKVQNRVTPPTEEEAREFYRENREHMVEPERVRARHILISTEERNRDEASSRAGEIYEMARRNPDNFSDLAREYSDGPTAARGGDLGYFSRDEMVSDFADAAFELEFEEISSPVETRFGFHVIKLIGRRAPERKTFEEIRNQLMQHIYQMRMEEAYIRFLQELREEANIRITLFND